MQIIKKTIRWTQDEDDFIKNNYLSMTDKEIGEYLKRSKSSVKAERLKLKLQRPYKPRDKNRKHPKPTFDEVKEMFKAKDMELISTEDEYVNQSVKLKYICNKHRDKGTQAISVHHLKNGRGCYYCGRERTNASRKSTVTIDEDRLLCELKGFDYVKTDIDNGIPFIYFICKKHRLLGIQKMRRGNMNRECVNGCQYCAYKNLPHWYVKYIIESTYDIEVLSEYNGMNKNLTCRCKIHDEIFTTLAKYIFHNGSGCKKCSKERMIEKSRLTLDEVKNRMLEKNPNIEILNLNKYVGYETIMRLRCTECGSVWECPFYSFVHNSGRCPCCQGGSLGEQVISKYLLDNNINFVPQFKFDDCRGDKNPLPFDFGILSNENNLVGLIEYNGEQHYRVVNYFGGKEKFKKQQEYDNKK